MTGAINTILPPALQKQLTAIKQADRASQDATIKLASGLDVNFAIDDPLSFFTSQTLRFRASDLSRLLDGVGNRAKRGDPPLLHRGRSFLVAPLELLAAPAPAELIGLRKYSHRLYSTARTAALLTRAPVGQALPTGRG